MRKRVTRFQTGARKHIARMIEHAQPHHARDAANAAVGLPYDQAQVRQLAIGPNRGRAQAITNDTFESSKKISEVFALIFMV